jgi:cytidylate kinase
MIITIDGPSASGKSTVAYQLAKRLGIYCVSSGFLYRGIAYVLYTYFGYNESTIQHISQADLRAALDPERFSFTLAVGCGVVQFDGQSLMSFLKSNEISQAASIIALDHEVRNAVKEILDTLARSYDIVAEGRDMGSVVFPQAECKFFITASVAVRAVRWQKMQEARGVLMSLQEARTEVETRDARDQGRAIAPLIIPKGGIVVDNSSMNMQETIQSILQYVVT